MLFRWNEICREENLSPDPEEATKFWSYIWKAPSTHNQDAKWLQRVIQELADVEKLGNIKIMDEICLRYV